MESSHSALDITNDSFANDDKWMPLPIDTTDGVWNDEAAASTVLEILSDNDGEEDHDDSAAFMSELRPMDILCGRTNKLVELHPGNRWFRCLIDMHKEQYQECPNQIEKARLVEHLLALVSKMGARFVEQAVLTRDDEWGKSRTVYAPVDRRTVMKKVRRALRRH